MDFDVQVRLTIEGGLENTIIINKTTITLINFQFPTVVTQISSVRLAFV